MYRLGVVLLLMGLGTGCAPTRVVRLEMGRGAPLVFSPRSGDVRPVELEADAFEGALQKLARHVRPSARPQEAARQLFEVEARSGWYRYEAGSRRVTPLGSGGYLEGEVPRSEVELTRAYLRWCERTGRPGDCLRLLVEGPTVNGDGRYTLALALAEGIVFEEMKDAFREMADPQAMLQAVLWTWTTYMILLMVPEPLSKGVAAIMTATLIAYVGLDTFWGLLVGFKQLMEAVDRATTFNELREAGERYGKVMGRNAARAFALLATAAIGNTASGLGAKVPVLPGAAQAAVQAESQVGLRLAAVGEVRAVAVSAESVTLTLAPNAVAMAARGTGGGRASGQGSPSSSKGPGEWVEVNESMSESARNYQSQVTGAPQGHAYSVKRGGEKADFDGYQDGVLLEAKGPNYAQFINKDSDFKGFFKGAGGMLEQAQRQSRVSGGTPIRWIVAEERLAAALRALFRDNNLKIEVVHVLPRQ